ncbi:hypothetical protein KP509_11G017700 [Ceratopteris richardii]|uniref:Uncharacterized protein n=1 Tax=Ceratopteris richardii TaxID=49495 RepID=A0A8T2TMF8_CERRI|nr:hypothetical protein KP509_11G017700 [Ceratopteris richardii]
MPKLNPSQRMDDSGLDWLPWLVAALVVAHLLALIYWIYCLASERPAPRRKTH